MPESDLIPEESTQPGSAPKAPAKGSAKKKKSIWADPVVRALAVVASGLVILYLATIVGAFFMGVIGSTEPKTALERDLQNFQGTAMQSPNDPVAWREYALVLIRDKQYRKAQDVIDKATKAVDQSAGQELLLAQAQLQLSQKDYDEAIKTSDEVRKKLKAYYDKMVKKTGSPEALGREINENYWAALFVKAQAQRELKQNDAALKSLDEYLKQKPTAADVLVQRGELRAEAGNKEGAEADFKQALIFLPQDKAALEGLKKIGAEQ